MCDHFTLFSHQAPDPPGSNLWTDWLRWLVCVMNHDDASLPFVASILSYALGNGLTDRQARAAQKILQRVQGDFQAGVLDCQIFSSPPNSDTHDLANMNPRGEA